MEANSKFQESLLELIQQKNISIETLGKDVSINPRTIRRWFEGRMPKLSSLIKLSSYFNCSIDFLLGLSDSPDCNTFGKTVDFYSQYMKLRDERNYKDYQVSKLCGIGTGTIAKWKNGRMPDTVTLIALCDVFSCSFEYLIGRGVY